MEAGVPWYNDAVIYGIDVEKFADGNDDGIGDFVGLAGKIAYIAELGVTCIWILPFFASPDRDNGYDVSDYYRVGQRVGTTADFLAFLHKAGEHGIRVIIDLVANHTSNEHPWFEAARRDEKSLFRNYYIWSPDPPPVEPGTHSIFPGEETSVWTYDEVARAYYFHKFYHFQPDLNIANPAVREEIERVVDYWLSLGISGFRIDAAPLVIGQNGLERANPTDPHGILRDLSAYVARRRPDGLLLGEVNLQPEEMGRYFGKGDQLGLLFNFMMACYIFGAMARQDATPIYQGLGLLPEPPTRCGWANFLRNLDELDFSQVPEDLKTDVFKAFAPEEAMQVYGRGVRRRLAPMLEGDQRRVELALSLVISMRGAPLLVYGDEIGMGEDLSQHGRNAVRTPMQWNDQTNAGFSRAAANKLVQTPIAKGKFSYKKVNVARQEEDSASLLNRTRRLIMTRRNHPIFRTGRELRLECSDKAVFAHGFEDGAELMVLLHNLSDRTVSAVVELGPSAATLSDLFSGEDVAADNGLKVELEPFGYRWLAGKRSK